MVWGAMRGRPRDLPYDKTPLRGAHVDTKVRIAWLMRVSRMASAQGGTGAAFCRLLAEHGYPIGVSALSRRESGQEDIPPAMMSAYERVLGLPTGQLRGAAEAQRRALDGAPRPASVAPMTRLELADELGRIDDLINSGGMRGGDWLSLAEVMSQPGGPILPPSIQQKWIYRLLTEMIRSVQGAYTARLEALSNLMVDPLTRDTVRDAIRTHINEPGAQAVVDAVSVLGEVHDPEVLDEALELFVTKRGLVRRGAAAGLLQPIVLGRLTSDEVQKVRRAILAVVRKDPDDGAHSAFMLAQRISLEMTREVVGVLGHNPGNKPAGAHIQTPAALHEYLSAAEAVSGIHGDKMLERLLREALSDDFVERQHHALMLLVVSPYRNCLAETAIQLVDGSADSVVRDAAGHMLGYLSGEQQTDHLVKLLEHRDPQLQIVGLFGLAHSCGVPATVDLGKLIANPKTTSAAIYAAGMSSHPCLDEAAVSESMEVRQKAHWWLRTGGGIREFEADAALQPAASIAS